MAFSLTTEQDAFCVRYIECGNVATAAKEAGLEFQKQGAAYYVYLLVDPATEQIFYVGKGKGRRMFAHVREARAGRIDNVQKYQRICAIHAAGNAVRVVVLANFQHEADAFAMERSLINRFTGLTNLSTGREATGVLAQERARAALALMLPLKEWQDAMPSEMAKMVESEWGSAEAFYKTAVAHLEFVAAGGKYVDEVTFTMDSEACWMSSYG
jgi:hypothetical protein